MNLNRNSNLKVPFIFDKKILFCIVLVIFREIGVKNAVFTEGANFSLITCKQTQNTISCIFPNQSRRANSKFSHLRIDEFEAHKSGEQKR